MNDKTRASTIELFSARGGVAKIMWWEDDGPFYSFAVQPSHPDTIFRIGPIASLDRAKRRCEDVIAGRAEDISNRAGYPRS